MPSASPTCGPDRRKFSLSELNGRPSIERSNSFGRASLTILRAPQAPGSPRSLGRSGSPSSSPRYTFGSPFSKSCSGPSLLFSSPLLPTKAVDVGIPMFNQPTSTLSPEQVFQAVSPSTQWGNGEDDWGGPKVCPEDILLPCALWPPKVELNENDVVLRFHDRVVEIREVLFKPCNKHLLDLLHGNQSLWAQLDAILRIPRDVMNDETWIAELKTAIKPAMGEAVWERTRQCLGIDSEDSYSAPDAEPLFAVDGVFDGDSYIESNRALSDIRMANSPRVPTSPLPFALDDVGSPTRHFRTLSNGSLNMKPPMSAISEFPEPKEPPKKLDSALLAEQDRRFGFPRRHWGSKRFSGMSGGSESPISEEEEPADQDGLATHLERRASEQSISSTDTMSKRLRGLKFTPWSPISTPEDEIGRLSICTVDSEDDDDRPFKPTHGIQYSFGFKGQARGPALGPVALKVA